MCLGFLLFPSHIPDCHSLHAEYKLKKKKGEQREKKKRTQHTHECCFLACPFFFSCFYPVSSFFRSFCYCSFAFNFSLTFVFAFMDFHLILSHLPEWGPFFYFLLILFLFIYFFFCSRLFPFLSLYSTNKSINKLNFRSPATLKTLFSFNCLKSRVVGSSKRQGRWIAIKDCCVRLSVTTLAPPHHCHACIFKCLFAVQQCQFLLFFFIQLLSFRFVSVQSKKWKKKE